MDSEALDNRPILLIDGLNLFVRNFIANPAMNTDGELVGGTVGTLATISRLVRLTKPKAVYMCWESGGSGRRRAIFPEYKAHRRAQKMNREYDDFIPDSDENEAWQKMGIVQCLKHVPVCQIYVPNCEADDVIGYLSRNTFFDQKKVIVSSDKDYYQLLDNNTSIYSPSRKTYVYESDVMKEFGITAANFCVAKAFCGDSSDNIPGVPRVGFKTLAKRFSVLGENTEITIEDLLMLNEEALSDKKKAKLKVHQNINQHADDVRRNWKLMYLDTLMLSPGQVDNINKYVDKYKPKKNKIQLYKSGRKFGLSGVLDFELFLSAFAHFR
jgi:DNA polymerase-1